MSISSTDLVHYFHQQINKVRTQPKTVIANLESRKFIKPYQFSHSLLPNVHYKTNEGQTAVKQAIAYLAQANPVPDLKLSEYLCEAAYHIGLQLSKSIDKIDVDKYPEIMQKQMSKAGIIESNETDIIVQYGFRQDPDIIPSIIVDDGDVNRHTRHVLMNPNHRFVGFSVHQNREYDYMLVILLNGVTKTKSGCQCAIF